MADQERTYDIRGAARHLGLSVQGIRQLEVRRTFPTATRDARGRRTYTQSDLQLLAACLDKARRMSIAEHPELAPMWAKMFAKSKVVAALAQRVPAAKPTPGTVADLEAQAGELELDNKVLLVQIENAKARAKAQEKAA